MCSFELSEAASANPFSLDPAGAAVVILRLFKSWIFLKKKTVIEKIT
jgi:hypothetical protein